MLLSRSAMLRLALAQPCRMAELATAIAAARQAEGLLGQAHETAAQARDASPSGSDAKAKARRIANRIEQALQALEKIE